MPTLASLSRYFLMAFATIAQDDRPAFVGEREGGAEMSKWGIIILFVQVSQVHKNSRKFNFCLKKCINPLHVMSLVWNEPWFI